jgi:hypothetical protein
MRGRPNTYRLGKFRFLPNNLAGSAFFHLRAGKIIAKAKVIQNAR